MKGFGCRDFVVLYKKNMMMMMMMMESPVGMRYELRSHSLLPVDPRMTDKADSCGELSTAVITGPQVLYLWTCLRVRTDL